ncbi:hypothetical protein NBE98_10805 [Clostridium swellfunianum]|uniref:hypothetical protein n=1 Tax=Clostridium swellfunianum TaxID=1367462 RepID=UPI00202FB31B|nr:hypothetical protein [Clostridium swellfunianum]MCM0648865.1 hypothetical protein [Clostridium swellfunianum]
MKKFIWVLCGIVVLALIFKGFTKERLTDENGASIKVYFPTPDKIIIYKAGNTETVTKDSKLFSSLVVKMNSRVSGSLAGTAGLAIDKAGIESIKKTETVVEFVYAKKQKTSFGSDKKEYSGLIFPMTGKYNDLCFFDTNTNHYSGPIGPMGNNNEVLELLK